MTFTTRLLHESNFLVLVLPAIIVFCETRHTTREPFQPSLQMRLRSYDSLATNALRSFALIVACLCLVDITSAQTPVAGASTNMVSGTQWPGGDPFLQRQNEPTMAISSRNPLHVVSGANDYRTVDLPFPNIGVAPVTGDAWLSFFTSYDGGATWTSNLVPGYPQDTSTQGSTCPANTKSSSTCSPVHGLNAGADPMVRGGTNGMLYYSGLAFDRDDSASSIFLARYIDDNNLEGTKPNPQATYTQGTPGSSIRYVGTSVISSVAAKAGSYPGVFYDKPTLAVDIPRFGAKTCVIPAGGQTTETQSFPGGRMYVAFTEFIGPVANNVAQIMFSESDDCGVTWSTPFKISGSAQTNQGAAIAVDPNTGIVFVVWRVFNFNNKDQNSIQGVALLPGTSLFTPVVNVTPIQPFDQGTSDVSFRTNAYPSIAIDKNSYIYVAWAQRNGGTQTALSGGDARIEVLSAGFVIGSNGFPTLKIAGPTTVDDYAGRGHQIMPAMGYSAGKLTIAWYDFRDDGEYFSYTPSTVTPGTYTFVLEPDGQLYGTSLPAATTLPIPPYQPGYYMEDPPGPYPNYQTLRHTVDVRAAQALSGVPPKFTPSVMVSQYAYGTPLINPATDTDEPDDDAPIEQLEFDAPNLPLFAQGTSPFVGDYIDVAGPTFIPSGTTWRYNNLTTDPDYTHVVWTDNRNVVPPSDGNWQNYTPVDLAPGAKSLYDGSTITTTCDAGHTGMRNQDIYTATLSQGVIMGALGNSKQLSSSIQRQFAVTVQNATAAPVSYQLSIPTQPSGGVASFLQFLTKGQSVVTTLDITIPALSSAATPVFITSSSATASVEVLAQQIDPTSGKLLSGGLTTSTVINPDGSNPPNADTGISSGETYNVVIANPNAANPNAANPNAANPNAANPNAANSAIANPAVADPNAANPNAANPNAANPNAANPNAANPNAANPNAANPNAANPNAANATVANPNAANPNAANPNAANVSVANTALLDTNYVVTNTGNTTASYNVQLVQAQQLPSNVLTQVIVSGIYTTPTASDCSLTLKANFVTLVSQTQPAFVQAGSTIPTTPTSTTPSFAIPPGGQALVTIRTYALGSSTPFDPTTAITPVVASTAANTGSTTPPISLTILTTTLGSVTAGGTLSQTLQAIGGSGTGYKWALSGSSNPSFVMLSQSGVLSGTVTNTLSGLVPITVEVTDSANNTATKTLKLTVINPPSITTSALNGGEQGVNYSQQLVGSGGTPPYAWSSSSLPPGLSFSTTTPGLLTGTPSTAATYSSVSITLTDSNHATATKILSLTIASPIAITTTALKAGDANVAYSQPIATTGGVTPLTYTLTGSLPAGLQLQNGAISGTPQAAGGPTNFTITVADSLGGSATKAYALTINQALTITNATLNPATYGTPFSQALQATGGAGGYTWAFQPGGSVPNGAAITPAGVLSWQPTGNGTFQFPVMVTDSAGYSAAQTLSLLVNPAPSAYLLGGGSTLPEGEEALSYSNSQMRSNGGGTPPLTWSATGLPSGISINSSTGALSGTPLTGTGGIAGTFLTYTPTITLKDANGSTALLPLSLAIAAPLAVPGNVVYSGEQHVPLNITLASTGGVGTLFWNIPPNIPGLTYSSAGTITGSPNGSGQYVLNPVTVTDALGKVVSETVTFNIASAPSVVTPTIPGEVVNTAITPIPLQATGGSGTGYSYGLASGSLPNGLLITNGQISGTPTQTGIFNFVVAVTDNANSTGTSAPLSMNVGPQVVVGPPAGFAYYTYPATLLQATGGSGNYTWSGASGIYNMMLTPNGLITGYPEPTGTTGFANASTVTDTVTVLDSTTGGSTTVPYTIVGSSTTTQAPAAPVTIQNVTFTVNNASSPLQPVVAPGTSVTTSFTATLSQVTYCPGCEDQVTVGFVGQPAASCTDFGVPGGTPETQNIGPVTLSTPTTPGRYYLVAHKAYEYGCDQAAYNEPLTTNDIVLAAVDVLPSPTVQIGPAAISGINIAGTSSNYALLSASTSGPTFPVNLMYGIPTLSPPQNQEIIFSLNTDPQAQICTYSGTVGISSNSGSGNLSPALIPGTPYKRTSRYYIAVEAGTGTCSSTNGVPWLTATPPNNDFTKFIGVVDVQ